jgi:hypothetical protein
MYKQTAEEKEKEHQRKVAFNDPKQKERRKMLRHRRINGKT